MFLHFSFCQAKAKPETFSGKEILDLQLVFATSTLNFTTHAAFYG